MNTETKTIECKSFQEFIDMIKNHTSKGYKVIQEDSFEQISYGYKCIESNQYWICRLSLAFLSIKECHEFYTKEAEEFYLQLKPMSEKQINMWNKLLRNEEEGISWTGRFNLPRNKMLDYLNNLL